VTFRREHVACTNVSECPACDHHDQIAVCEHDKCHCHHQHHHPQVYVYIITDSVNTFLRHFCILLNLFSSCIKYLPLYVRRHQFINVMWAIRMTTTNLQAIHHVGYEIWSWCLTLLSTIFQLYRGGHHVGKIVVK